MLKKYSILFIFMFCLIFTGCGNGGTSENSSFNADTEQKEKDQTSADNAAPDNTEDSDKSLAGEQKTGYPVFDFQEKTVTLNSGYEMPILGLGMFSLSDDEAENSTYWALKSGYSLVDTANAYVNERACGRGMKESGLKREDIFLSTKLWPSEYENENAVEETLERLGVDYVDLLYIHQPAGNWLAGYRQLIKKERQEQSVFQILRANILRSLKQSGRSCRSSSRWRHILILHRKSSGRR